MNVGFFIQSNAGTPQNTKIYKFLNDAVQNKTLRDATVFFNDIGFNPVQVKFGMFDGADLWSFKGNLICTSIENLRKAISTVNAIKIAYLFSPNDAVEKHIFDFVNISKAYRVLVNNVVDQNTFYRLTGVKPVLVEDWSVSKLKEVFDE
jgi:hypothetical protein